MLWGYGIVHLYESLYCCEARSTICCARFGQDTTNLTLNHLRHHKYRVCRMPTRETVFSLTTFSKARDFIINSEPGPPVHRSRRAPTPVKGMRDRAVHVVVALKRIVPPLPPSPPSPPHHLHAADPQKQSSLCPLAHSYLGPELFWRSPSAPALLLRCLSAPRPL